MRVNIPDGAASQRTVLEVESEFSDDALRELSSLNPGYAVERQGKKRVVMSPFGYGASYRTDETEDFLPLCPDLFVEVMSPSDRLPTVRAKCARWVAEGARASVPVNAGAREAECLTQDGVARSAEEILAIPGFEGLILDFRRIWGDPGRAVRDE